MSSRFMLAAAGAAAVLMSSQAGAATVDVLAFKLSDLAPANDSAGRLDAYTGWTTAGGFNEGVAGATSLANNGIDYRSAMIDTGWDDVLAVRVSMYALGQEVAFVEFDATGTTSTDFFSVGNVTGSSWPDDLTSGGHNYFSIAGHSDIDRHWFIETNYGGCGSDVGHMVVVDGRAGSCSWETTRTDDVGLTDRGFLYSTLTGDTNWNNTGGQVGVADVFAVHLRVTRDEDPGPGPSPVPLPASALLMGAALGGLGLFRRRRG